MGKISQNILGNISGTVGNLVYVRRNGVSYVQRKPGPRTGESTPAQRIQQARFGLLIKFLQPLKGFLVVGFRDKRKLRSGMNLAVSYNIRDAITGTYPNLTIDPARITLSQGRLPNAVAPAVSSTETGLIRFTWTNNSGIGGAQAEDKAMLVACIPALRQAKYNCKGAPRNKQEDILVVPEFSGMKVETYISFVAENGITADSFYTGSVTVL